MGKPLTVTTKLIILLGCAVLFGATLVALSTRSSQSYIDERFGDENKSVEQTFQVEPDGKLLVDTDVGNILVTGTDANEVHMRVTADGRSEELDRFKVDFSQDGNVVTIKGRYRNRSFQFFENNWIEAHFEIQVPKKFNLDLHTAGGNLTLQSIDGKLLGETSGGDLELTDTRGNIRMNTSGGNIILRDIDADLTAETSGGDIKAQEVRGKIHVETSGGNISFRDSDASLYASTSGGDIRVSMRDNRGIDLSTSGGNISVSLPKSVTADILAESTGGEVTCDFAFSGKLREGSLDGRVNGGGNLIKAETSGGDISINAVE